MLTPFDCTLAAQSATRWVVSFAAWIPLSVNCTKLMYVAMMSFSKHSQTRFLSERDEFKPRATDSERQMTGTMMFNSFGPESEGITRPNTKLSDRLPGHAQAHHQRDDVRTC